MGKVSQIKINTAGAEVTVPVFVTVGMVFCEWRIKAKSATRSHTKCYKLGIHFTGHDSRKGGYNGTSIGGRIDPRLSKSRKC